MPEGDPPAPDATTLESDPLHPPAVAYAVALEEREKILRNLRIPATGFALFAMLKITSTLTNSGPASDLTSSILFWISLIAFIVAWAINHTANTSTSIVRQLLFIMARLSILVFEVWLIVEAVQQQSKPWLTLAGLSIAIILNVANIALIIKAKAIDRHRSETAYVLWTLASHVVFSAHALLVFVLGTNITPPAKASKISTSWQAALIAGTAMSHVLQHIIYKPETVNSLLVSFSKESSFHGAVATIYVALLIWIICGSFDLADMIKKLWPWGGERK